MPRKKAVNPDQETMFGGSPASDKGGASSTYRDDRKQKKPAAKVKITKLEVIELEPEGMNHIMLFKSSLTLSDKRTITYVGKKKPIRVRAFNAEDYSYGDGVLQLCAYRNQVFSKEQRKTLKVIIAREGQRIVQSLTKQSSVVINLTTGVVDY